MFENSQLVAVRETNVIGVVGYSYSSGNTSVALYPKLNTLRFPERSLRVLSPDYERFQVGNICLVYPDYLGFRYYRILGKINLETSTCLCLALDTLEKEDIKVEKLIPFMDTPRKDEEDCLKCDLCGEKGNRFLEGYGFICDDCFSDNSVTCVCCDNQISDRNNFHCINDEIVCENCYENYYRCCSRCGELYHIDSLNEHDVCESCLENANVCANCGRTFFESSYEDEEICEYCSSEAIHDYGYRPYPNFYGSHPNGKYFGIEWEIGAGGKNGSNALSLLKGTDQAYIKYDGSVGDGFEFVTHPCTPEYHLTKFGWDDYAKRARRMGYSGIEGTGIHIHVSRDSMTTKGIASLIWFFERNWKDCMIFARRTESELYEWAWKYGCQNPYKCGLESFVRQLQNEHGRYKAVNLQNCDTIEIRIFRSSVKTYIIKSYIQFTDIITELCESGIAEDFGWADILTLANDKGYSELIEYTYERLPYLESE